MANTKDGWTKKSKGSAHIYTKDGVPHAIVDRRGNGLDAASGHNITFDGVPFEDVEAAKAAADALHAYAILKAYLSQTPRELSDTEAQAMSDEAFDAVLESSRERPVILTSLDEETGETRKAYLVPVDRIADLLGNIVEDDTPEP